ncbi:unnamed protein product [Arctia plantaginis]|uniref:Uncharacterized protein n=1 Tax=Arctia plantaginis TaxID=874455 RepID=A0A8S1A8K5_ARCPL|nr:unnamed protein product [Arctia plantaginis]
MIDLLSKDLNLKSCYVQGPEESRKFECEVVRYHNLKNVDKLLFLSKNIPDKTFYIVDCLIYEGGERVCHKKDDINMVYAHANLVDTGTLVRPNETGVLAQDEFICEESKVKEINCDLNPYVPFTSGLKLKESMKFNDNVLLKSGTYVVILKRNCIGSWCGYTGKVTSGRRSNTYNYKVPGDTVYRCYYAKRQQVCKPLYSINERSVYNQRGHLNSW